MHVAGLRRADQAAGRHVPADDQDDHRAAAVRDARRRHCGHRRPEGDGPHRPQGHHLFRGRHDDRAVPRPVASSTSSSPAPGCRSPAMSTDSLKAVQSIQAHTGWDMLVSLFPTSVVDAMARGDILQVVMFSIFFGIGLAAVGERGQARVRRAREHGAGDVQVHRLRHEVRADRRHGRDFGDGRQDGPRHPAHAGQARAADVRRPHRLCHRRDRRRLGTSFACRSSRSCGRSGSRS